MVFINQPFEIKTHIKNRLLRPKTFSKQLLNNFNITFNKVKITGVFDLKMVKMGQNDDVTAAKISRKNLDFGGHQKLFRADITHKYGPVKS